MKSTLTSSSSLINKWLSEKKIYIFILLNILFSQLLYSQLLQEKSDELSIKAFKEELYISTDRDIYMPGEEVWFKVYKINGLTHSPSDVSKVVYLELLDKNNFPLRQLKVKTDLSSGSSGFFLPDNISSGNYLIRAYTNWMKNFSPDLFFYKTLSVINPFESIDHLKLPSTDTVDWQSKFLIIDDKGTRIREKSVLGGNNEGLTYTVTINKPEYKPREKVKILISATDRSGNPVETDMSVSVAKSEIASQTGTSGFNGFNLNNGIVAIDSEPRYLPELEGHLISGTIRMKVTDEPLKNIDVSLAYVGKTARCQFTKTDNNGQFNFVVRGSGMNEIVIQPLSSDITGYYVELNQSFSASFSNFKPSTFFLDSSKIVQINNAIVSMQIQNIYEPFRQNSEVTLKNRVPDFYGRPENTIKMSDYIELTSVREVVKEIIPNVYTLKQNGKYDFKLINKFRGQPFENKPLILVDGVPIYDFEKVLSINSKEIERVDVINTRYFFSENIFDGIVSFITKKGNLSAMQFDNSIFRQVYEACQLHTEFFSPDYSSTILKNSHIPDYRNTIYWNPDLRTTIKGKTEIEFFTSDEKAEYTIVVEGISNDGETGLSRTSVIVK
jgi:hypothetical protein